MTKLKSKTVFITGGLSGIGKACAIAAAVQGANIVIADLASDSSELALDEIRKVSTDAHFIPCDVSKFDQVEKAIAEVLSIFGSFDVALNNAGIGGEASMIGEMSEKAWLQVIGVNLNGVFNCMRHELFAMHKAKKGVIVNMSSILGKVGFANAGHYVAAKHGIIGLTETAALEYAPFGIRVNALCPGFIDTPLLTKAGIADHNEAQEAIIAMHPLKRLGSSEEIAHGFIFLASDDSSFVTGTALAIDGGYLSQ